MASEYPHIGQALFREALEEKVKQGLTPKEAIDSATVEAAGRDIDKKSVDAVAKDRMKNPTLRPELGLEDPETKQTFGKLVVEKFQAAAVDGSFPAWIEEVEDSGQRAKLKLDYLKAFKQDMATALIASKSEVTQKTEISEKADYELEFYATRDRWPNVGETNFYLNAGHWPDEETLETGRA